MDDSEKKRPAEGTSLKKPAQENLTSSSSNNVMDPELWGTLQHHLNLTENVYMKLPLTEFFQLRGVCKEWNRLAVPRRCPTERLHKPYFVITHRASTPFVPYHAGVLTLSVASGQWKWSQLPFESNQMNRLYQPFSVKGVLLGSRTDCFKICDVHRESCPTGYIHLPTDDNTRQIEMEQFRALAMAVDTSTVPYTFKLILGGPKTRTLIYDHSTRTVFTNSRILRSSYRHPWTTKSSLMLTPTSKRWNVKSCINSESEVYMWSQMNKILVYSLTEDIWSTLEPPRQPSEVDRVEGALGYWDGRVFLVMADEDSSLALWELVSSSEQTWRKFACIPSKLQACLMPSLHDYEHVHLYDRRVYARFCDEHVLLHTLLDKMASRTGIGRHFVLFNLVTKSWVRHWVGSYGEAPIERL